MKIKGLIRTKEKTKDLVKEISPKEVALISHRDLDQLAALSLVQKRVKAVLNRDQSISGRYPNKGPRILLEEGIYLLDEVVLQEELKDGDLVLIKDGSIFKEGRLVGRGQPMTPSLLFLKEEEGNENLRKELDTFVENTLSYAKKEKSLILHLQVPKTQVKILGKHVLVVVRAPNYKEDLHAITPYLLDFRPIIIGVDGGADGALELGFPPHVIIGDMDSVSDKALQSGAELIVHAYPKGKAPGMKRIKDLGLTATTFKAPGISEDIALLLAYEQGAALIAVVGGHSSCMDFLEKGRKGMGSTFLVRLKMGEILVDAKGINRLYQGKTLSGHLYLFMGISLIPVLVLLLISPPLNHLLRLMILNLRFLLGL